MRVAHYYRPAGGPNHRWVILREEEYARLVAEVEAGKAYFWCACGLSKSQPFCDGSHKGTGLAPMKYSVEKAGDYWLCDCKHSSKKPLCDGTHKTLA